MIIDRNASVTPHRFESPRLRRTIGKRLGRADRDDMLRALLLVSEVRMAGNITAAWREFYQKADREFEDAGRRRDRLSWRRSDQVAVGCCKAAGDLAAKLWGERQEAAEALEQCEQIAQGFSSRVGLNHDGQTDLADSRAALAVLNDYLTPARQRFNALLADDCEALHSLARREERKRESAGTLRSTIEQLDSMAQEDFDDAIRQALENSGFQTSSREARVIDVTRGGGKGLVFCANVQNPASSDTTDVRAILTAQRLALSSSLAKVLVVTNQQYISRAADRLTVETSPSIRLIQRFELQQWVEWGMPLRDVLADD
ncbi:restriction endonuclease [Streptomyces sp. NPDC056601]|uniref:restriction endonuclease n=1 Tax=Streptomyces sp. NPDC056601 TaxID=3345875 RepID=UPI0036C69071